MHGKFISQDTDQNDDCPGQLVPVSIWVMHDTLRKIEDTVENGRDRIDHTKQYDGFFQMAVPDVFHRCSPFKICELYCDLL